MRLGFGSDEIADMFSHLDTSQSRWFLWRACVRVNADLEKAREIAQRMCQKAVKRRVQAILGGKTPSLDETIAFCREEMIA